jgi:hypothetical protein
MSKERKIPTILKPIFNEEAALRFASTETAPVSGSETVKSTGAVPRKTAPKKRDYEAISKDMKQISLAIKKSLYDRIAKDAARKDRTVEEHIQKHLAKRYGK